MHLSTEQGNVIISVKSSRECCITTSVKPKRQVQAWRRNISILFSNTCSSFKSCDDFALYFQYYLHGVFVFLRGFFFFLSLSIFSFTRFAYIFVIILKVFRFFFIKFVGIILFLMLIWTSCLLDPLPPSHQWLSFYCILVVSYYCLNHNYW